MERINSQILHEKATPDVRVPHDIIEKFLARLPVKSLLRFKTVSKQWEATISDPVFDRFHLHLSKISSSCQYLFTESFPDLVREPRDQYIGIHPEEQALPKFKLFQLKNQELQVERVIHFPKEFEDTHVMCCLDGLVLLWHAYLHDLRHYVLWNPSTTTFMGFKYPYPSNYEGRPLFTGICYDPLIEDYKVVMGDWSYYAVFNCRDKRWTKKKKLSFNLEPYEIDSPGVYFNGSFYWVLNKELPPNFDTNFKIVRFDPRYDDKMEEVCKPNVIQNEIYTPFILVLLGGHLCLFYTSYYQFFIMKKDDDRDSWTKFVTFDNVFEMIFPEPLLMTNENGIVFQEEDFFEYLNVCNPSRKAYTKIKTSLWMESKFFPFVESLVLITRRNRGWRKQKAFEELSEVFFFDVID